MLGARWGGSGACMTPESFSLLLLSALTRFEDCAGSSLDFLRLPDLPPFLPPWGAGEFERDLEPEVERGRLTPLEEEEEVGGALFLALASS